MGKAHSEVVNNHPEARGTKKGGDYVSIVQIISEQDEGL